MIYTKTDCEQFDVDYRLALVFDHQTAIWPKLFKISVVEIAVWRSPCDVYVQFSRLLKIRAFYDKSMTLDTIILDRTMGDILKTGLSLWQP